MPQIGPNRLRFIGDATDPWKKQNVLTNATGEFAAGTDIQFELRVDQAGDLADVSNIESLTLEVKPTSSAGGAPEPSEDPLMEQTLSDTDLDNSLDAASWDDGSKQHALFSFTKDETGLAAQDAWLLVYALTSSGQLFTLVATNITIRQDGGPSVGDPAPATPTYYTGSQSDNRYLRQSELLQEIEDDGSPAQTTARANLGLGNVENVALSTWSGSASLTTLGTITAGTWQGDPIADSYIASAATWNAKQDALTVGVDYAPATSGSAVLKGDGAGGFAEAASPADYTKLDLATGAPASAAATGTQGEVRYDANYFYLCIATDTWVRIPVTTW